MALSSPNLPKTYFHRSCWHLPGTQITSGWGRPHIASPHIIIIETWQCLKYLLILQSAHTSHHSRTRRSTLHLAITSTPLQHEQEKKCKITPVKRHRPICLPFSHRSHKPYLQCIRMLQKERCPPKFVICSTPQGGDKKGNMLARAGKQ